jgi:hypothetical protein
LSTVRRRADRDAPADGQSGEPTLDVRAERKFNGRIDRFRRRGRAAVRAEWRLITATHNLLKLHRHATAAA